MPDSASSQKKWRGSRDSFAGDQRQLHLYAAIRQAYSFTLFFKQSRSQANLEPAVPGYNISKTISAWDQSRPTHKDCQDSKLYPSPTELHYHCIPNLSDGLGTSHFEKMPHVYKSSFCFVFFFFGSTQPELGEELLGQSSHKSHFNVQYLTIHPDTTSVSEWCYWTLLFLMHLAERCIDNWDQKKRNYQLEKLGLPGDIPATKIHLRNQQHRICGVFLLQLFCLMPPVYQSWNWLPNSMLYPFLNINLWFLGI